MRVTAPGNDGELMKHVLMRINTEKQPSAIHLGEHVTRYTGVDQSAEVPLKCPLFNLPLAKKIPAVQEIKWEKERKA